MTNSFLIFLDARFLKNWTSREKQKVALIIKMTSRNTFWYISPTFSNRFWILTLIRYRSENVAISKLQNDSEFDDECFIKIFESSNMMCSNNLRWKMSKVRYELWRWWFKKIDSLSLNIVQWIVLGIKSESKKKLQRKHS